MENQISKINKLDQMKEEHEKKVSDHNIKIRKFNEICVDFMVRHQIYDMPREFVFRNRQTYAAYFILAIIEMMKYAAKEDYESSKTDINVINITLEYIKPEKKGNRSKSALPKTMKDSSKKKKKIQHLKNKQANQKYDDSSEDSQDDELGQNEENKESKLNEELFEDEAGSYYLRFKEGLPNLVKKDLMVDDLWLLMKRPLVTS